MACIHGFYSAMTDKQATTRTNGRFKKGHSGNPKGRPPMLAPELKQRLHEVTPEIIEKVAEKALEGDLGAAKIILDRTSPIAKKSSTPISIPKLSDNDAGLGEKADAVLESIAIGDCPADVGATLIQAIVAYTKILEIDELERRITALEALS